MDSITDQDAKSYSEFSNTTIKVEIERCSNNSNSYTDTEDIEPCSNESNSKLASTNIEIEIDPCSIIDMTECSKDRKSGRDKKLKCKQCDRHFSSLDVLRLHALLHDKASPKKRRTRKKKLKKTALKTFQCNVCEKMFNSKAKITSHLEEHSDKVYQCDVCEKIYRNSAALQLHVQYHGEKCHECEQCGKKFALKSLLSQHKRVHKTLKFKRVCHICNGSFSSPYHLTRHMTVHEKEGIEVNFDQSYMHSIFSDCTNLEDSAASAANVDEGSVTVFTFGEATNKCDECGKVYIEKEDLIKHLKKHESESSYTCHICKKEFKLNYYLKLHLRTHTGEKPYECEVCKKTFVTSSKLSRHVKGHSGVKEHQCDLCHKFYSRAGYLRRHMKMHKQSDGPGD